MAYGDFGPTGLNMIQTCANADLAQNPPSTDNRQFAPRVVWRGVHSAEHVLGGYGIVRAGEQQQRMNPQHAALSSSKPSPTPAARDHGRITSSAWRWELASTNPTLTVVCHVHADRVRSSTGISECAGGRAGHGAGGGSRRQQGDDLYVADPIDDPRPARARSSTPAVPDSARSLTTRRRLLDLQRLQVKYEKAGRGRGLVLVPYTYSSNIFTQDLRRPPEAIMATQRLWLPNIPQI